MKKAAAVLVAALLAGCASPPTHFFTLMPTPGTAVPGGPRTVLLRRPGLAGYLDRSEIVLSGGVYQLRLATNEQWAEPFGSLLGRVLVEDLGRRLPGTSVYTEAGAISADPDLTVELDVQRFDGDPGGAVVLQVQWSLERGRGNPIAPPVTDRVSVPAASPSTTDVVAAMSQALGQEADTIAAAIRVQGARAEAAPSTTSGGRRTRR